MGNNQGTLQCQTSLIQCERENEIAEELNIQLNQRRCPPSHR